MNSKERRLLDAVCRRILGSAPDRVESFSTAPTGAERRTWRLHVGARVVYATRRLDPALTTREAFVLCDPSVPDAVDTPGLLFESAAAWGSPPDRVAAMGVAHIGTRLSGCLTGPAGLDISWTDALANDWLGSREAVGRLCRRGADVACRDEGTLPLAAWFGHLDEAFADR